MKRMNTSFRWTALTLASAVMLAACGGGGGSAAGPTAQPAALYAGPITGFGSVVVNGVRFSSVGTELVDDDGAVKNMGDLKLGMTVRVSGEADDNTELGSASQLELVHGTRGQLTAADVIGLTATSTSFTLLGQIVHTDDATAYQGVAGLAALTVGQHVEVYGVLQADGSLLATLIELKAMALTTVRLSGRMNGLDSSTTTFQVGSLSVNYGTAKVTGTLGDGKRVKIKAASGPVGNVLTATSVHVSEASAVYGATVTTGAQLKLKGVAETAPVGGLLNVSGTPVNVAQAQIKGKGGSGAITAGQFIVVKGIWDGSVLQATKVELKGFRDHHNELYGAVSSVDSSVVGIKTVVVNGVTVELRVGTTQFEHGTLAQVTVGSYVEIKGNLVGSTLQATKVELKSMDSAKGVGYEHSGPISDFVSTGSFRVKGLTVDASAAIFEHGGTMANLANGVYVEIKGAQNSAGVFVATKVEIRTGSGS